MDWFDHSSTAASDDAIMALRMEHPDSAAVDCYWAIIEKQYLEERPVPFEETNMETKALTHRLCVGFEQLSKYVETMCEVGLLKRDNGFVYSERANETIAKYQAKRETARQNGKKGGRKPTRKPKGNRRLTNAETQPLANNNNNTSIGLDKLNQYQYASGGAEADESAPPSATKPVCPVCESDATFNAKSAGWECPVCGAIKEPRFVAWKEAS